MGEPDRHGMNCRVSAPILRPSKLVLNQRLFELRGDCLEREAGQISAI